MISILGRPKMPLTHQDQPDRVSDVVRKMLVTSDVGPFHATGIAPAIASLRAIFSAVQIDHPDLIAVLGTAGMLDVRYRNPTSGTISWHISNHSWGTAIDLTLDGGPAPGNTGQMVPLGIALLVSYFNKEGWYSGISFHDDMHFEVCEEAILDWQRQGRFKQSLLVA